MAFSNLQTALKYTIMFTFFRRMNKLLYIFLPNEFLIGQVIFQLSIKRLAVAMLNKTISKPRLTIQIMLSVHPLPKYDLTGLNRLKA
jgi:hypothetical protein